MATLIANEVRVGGTPNGSSPHSALVRRANGDLWAIVYQYDSSFNGSTWQTFWYSKNNGATWTNAAGSDIHHDYPNGTDASPSLFVDLDGYIHHFFFRAGAGPNNSQYGLMYRRGAFAADGNSIAWSAETVVSTGQSNTGSYKEVIAHRDPAGTGGWYVHLLSNYSSTYYAYCYYQRLFIAANGAVSLAYPANAMLQVKGFGGISPYGANSTCSFDFEHTGDGVTVLNGTPNIWISVSGFQNTANTLANKALEVLKITYSAAGGGTWTVGALNRVSTTIVENNGSMWGRWDGTRFVIAGQERETSQPVATQFFLRVYDVNTAGTAATRTDLINGANYAFKVGDTGNQGAQVAGGAGPVYTSTRVQVIPGGDILFVGPDASSGSQTLLVNYRKWTRATNSLGAFTQLTAHTGTNYLYGTSAVARLGGTLDSVVMQTATGTPSSFSDYYGGAVSFAPNAPTAVGPANGATVNTDIPVLSVTFSAGANQKGEWQIATDTGFTTNLRDIVEADTDVVGGPATNTENLPLASKLYQGTWYVRARSVGPGGVLPSAWSGTNTFTVSHPPTSSGYSPTGGQYAAYGVGNVRFSWTFQSSSPPSTQTAYQVIVERVSDGALVLDTGKVTTPNQYADLNIAAGYKDVDLRWRVRLWDNDNVLGAYSANQIFRLGDGPTVTVTAPADGEEVTVNNPQAQWTFAAGGGRLQANFRVVYKRTADNVVLHDSGTIAGAATSYTPPGFVVDNNTDHTVTVTVTDTGGIQNSDSNTFTTSWIPPDQPIFTVDASQFSTAGYVALQWDDSLKDATWYSWRIYRRLSAGGSWELVDELFTDQPVNTYHDYLASANIQQDWAVVQVVTRFGSQVESTRNTASDFPADDHYWLIVANNDDGVNLRLAHVTGDSFSEQYEQAEIHLLGRGRHIEYGDRFGYAGTVTGELRDNDQFTARAQRLLLDQIKLSQEAVWLRNPFGDVWHVSTGDLSYERIPGVGTSEFTNVTLPYSEVTE